MNDSSNIDIEDVQQAQAQTQAAQDEQQQQAIIFLKKFILVLEQKETFPLQTRNKTDELVGSFPEAALNEQQQQQAVVIIKKMILVLEYKETFPLQTRIKTDELVEKFLEEFVVDNFLAELKNDVHEMLCADLTDPNSDNYRGLDSERDTEAEVEAIVRVFPEVLMRRKFDEDNEHGNIYYPIQLLAIAPVEGNWQCNVKAVSFIPIIARLAIEFDLFEEEERGGLLCDYGTNGLGPYAENALIDLMLSDRTELHNQEHHESVETKYLQVLIELRQLGLLKKEDIQSYTLLHKLCRRPSFAEKRFCFLVEWDPSAITKPDAHGYLPIHCGALPNIFRPQNTQGFQHTFGYGIRYFPKKKGISLLFKKNNHDGHTPFQYACKTFGREKVMEAVEDTLIRCYNSSSDDTPPLHIVSALMTAANDENIHLDCVYFLMRRKPDVLMKQLPPLPYISNLRKRKRDDHGFLLSFSG
ncbi:hypothetical protein FRACYDRAFT_263044 [Fragilariopsis cylindrus CCMP1102]|uniref:Ankyrin n=1 Tax=Fragilariopsis cylindrus CCMP1102 TaxID=635003 RepID=A0A1E7F3L0_9STRA|nr:hypothetical protein FRACYDRAFT_263044 [Fragilariopsis cylindrus CCMP1102]|eukprot:OEU12762.1 hypothetical protein FRACYDRAFT_263044 [Fragilariopsis cylindrus CCMP1102]